MLDRSELAGAVAVGGVALAVTVATRSVYLVPVGFLAGIVVGLRADVADPPSETALSGASSGAAGAVIYAMGAVPLRVMEMMALLPTGLLVDLALFRSFALTILLVPLYGIEGFAAGPAVRWLRAFGTRTFGHPDGE